MCYSVTYYLLSNMININLPFIIWNFGSVFLWDKCYLQVQCPRVADIDIKTKNLILNDGKRWNPEEIIRFETM